MKTKSSLSGVLAGHGEEKRTPRVRREFPPGPWDNEPDRVEFEHAGLPCLLLRNDLGSWCGYAAVPPGHPWHGGNYEELDIDVHGGLTYADFCNGEICHVPKAGEPENVFWFGFDCAHFRDLVPSMLKFGGDRLIPPSSFIYRDVEFVRAETMRLAEQLAKAGKDAAERNHPDQRSSGI